MGYTTDFTGSFSFDKKLQPEHIAYLQAFNQTRRMKRDSVIAETLKDEVRIKAGLPIGEDGAYYVGSHKDGQFGQSNDKSILDNNTPPGQYPYEHGMDYWEKNKKQIKNGKCQPSLWCQWTVSDEGTELEWDGGEKFYYYTEWLKYLITHFISKWGYVLNGEVKWDGEDSGDMGKIVVKDNEVTAIEATITY